MKDLLKYLPQLLSILPSIIKYVPILLIIGGVGYGGWYFANQLPPTHLCINNELYELQLGSTVYSFKGTYCIDKQPPVGGK